MNESLAERLLLLMNKQGLTNYALSVKIGVSPATIGRTLKGSKPSSKTLKSFSDYFQVSESWLLTGMKSKNQLYEKTTPEIINEKESYYKEVPFYKKEVFEIISPAMSDILTLKAETFVKIPMFSRGEAAIQITGSSMKGFINHGDFCVIRRIWDHEHIIYGECYVVVTKINELCTVKFLNEHNNPELIWLIPYNTEGFEPQAIKRCDIIEIYQVLGILRKINL